jgi:SET domain-containing protein
MTAGEPKLKVKRTDKGLGLFALEPIPAREPIIEYSGPIIPAEERFRIGGKYLFKLDKNRAIDGRSRGNLARYINHACRPNAIAFIEDEQVWIWSRRKIQAGEEITINYGKAYFNQFIAPMGCKCEKCAD